MYHLFLRDDSSSNVILRISDTFCYKHIQIEIYFKQNSNMVDATAIKSPASGDDEE